MLLKRPEYLRCLPGGQLLLNWLRLGLIEDLQLQMVVNLLKQEVVFDMKMKEIETRYGVTFGRNALILLNTDLNFHPFKLAVNDHCHYLLVDQWS